ncbi:MAG TPA: aspartate kinase, partial [Dehalococcoidia bacterium]
GDTTDDLIELANKCHSNPPKREMDQLLATGEQVSIALMAMTLESMGVPAVSLTGGQVGIITEPSHTRAKIKSVARARLEKELAAGKVPVVAGFQGLADGTAITAEGETCVADTTTLGRGGSDTTAVALAAALGADECEIYTDVDGIYTTDPRIEPNARKLRDISYEEMLELASQGARVMHPRAVELGEVYRLPILVASSFREAPGTLIHGGVSMEQRNKVRGIAHDTDVAKITVRGVPDRPGIAAAIFEPLAEHGISVDTIVQNASLEGLTDLTFTVSRGDLAKAMEFVEPVAREIGAAGCVADGTLGKVSVVGTGMQSAPGYAARMFRALFEAGINIEMISTSEIRITCIIKGEQVADAVRALHKAFQLERAEEEPAQA